MYKARYERLRLSARQALGEERFESLLVQGDELSLNKVIALADGVRSSWLDGTM